MAYRDAVQLAASKAHFVVSRTLGIPITYNSRGTPITGLYALPTKRGTPTINRLTVGTRSADIHWQFEIPVQTNFPPTNGPAVDDLITAEGDVYRVTDWNVDEYGAVYTCTVAITTAEQVGAVGQGRRGSR